jgi:phosphatidylinositol alpha-1,6-mannosyltransferase
MVRLTPGVDAEVFSPDVDGSVVRKRYGLDDRPVILCVSRLMKRKGQDSLLGSFAAVKRRIPDAALLLVGGGPDRKRLQTLARETGYLEHVIFTGSVPWTELPSHYAAGTVFAMPCRTRRGGLDVEGLGIVYLEASASGLPVVAGDSGGAPDAVLEGETGFVIPNDEGALVAIVDRLTVLLADPTMRNRLAQAGRGWVKDAWSWERQVSTLQTLL